MQKTKQLVCLIIVLLFIVSCCMGKALLNQVEDANNDLYHSIRKRECGILWPACCRYTCCYWQDQC